MTNHKLKKKKEREKKVQEKLYNQRMERIKQSKYDKMIDRDVAANAPKKTPIKKLTPLEQLVKKAELHSKLEHNMKIFKALEEEHERQNLSREQFNEELEANGHLTPKQKLEAIVEKAKALQQGDITE